MEETNLVTFIVISSTAVILLVIVVLLDIIFLMRKRRLIAKQEGEISQRKIDELIMKNEVESVNALLKGQNSERRRISQELHDRLGSILFTAKLYHGNIESKIKALKAEHDEGFDKLTGLLDDAVLEVRRISHDLYTGSLSTFGYHIAIRQLISAIKESNEMDIALIADEELDAQKDMVQHELYAITQELLSNTLKHAKASRVEIEIRVEDHLVFQYHDNGIGFNANQAFDGIGLKNIRNRANKLKGKLTIESSPKSGSFFYLIIPIEL